MSRDCSHVSNVCKGVNETARVGIDFVDMLAEGETLNDPPTVTVTPASGAPTVSGQDITTGVGGGLTVGEARVAGGSAGTFKVWIAVTTSAGQVRKKYLALSNEAES